MLDAGAAVVIHILLDLRLLLARGRLVDWHLDLGTTNMNNKVIGEKERNEKIVLMNIFLPFPRSLP